MAWFSVSIEVRGDGLFEMTDDEFGDRLGELVVSLEAHSGVAVGGGDHPRWGATISVESATALTAIVEASAIIRRAGSDAFLPSWQVVRAEAVREDVLDEDLAARAGAADRAVR